MSQAQPNDAVIDMNGGAEQKDSKDVNTLFGPNIGIMDAGPKWTEPLGEKVGQDEITPDVVKVWIDKSKEVRITLSCSSSKGQELNNAGV